MAEGKTFVVVAGEASGDTLGGGLIRELRERFPESRFFGICGPNMLEAGCEPWFNCDQLAVMGLAEVLSHLPRLLKIRAEVVTRTIDLKPTCYIGIDAPDFNLPVARKLKKSGVRTVQYVSPSIWAWRGGRAAKIARDTDLVLTLFPHEPDYYKKHGGNARFVGHPLADSIDLNPDQSGARRELNLSAEKPLLALLPGSRNGEVKRLAPAFLQAAQLLADKIPDLQFVSPQASPAIRSHFHELQQSIAPDLPLTLLDRQASQAMIASDAVLLASGTAALEALLCKRPMVIAYRIAPVTYAIVKGLRLLKGDYYSLPNVLAGRQIAPEILQNEVTPQSLADALLPLLHPDTRTDVQADFLAIHQRLRRNANARAADAVAELING